VNVRWELGVGTYFVLISFLEDTPELTGRLDQLRVVLRSVLHRCCIKVILLAHQVRREIETVLLYNLT